MPPAGVVCNTGTAEAFAAGIVAAEMLVFGQGLC